MQEIMTKEKPLKFKQWKVEEIRQYLEENLGVGPWQKTFKDITDQQQDITVVKLVELLTGEPERLQILNALKKLWQIQSKVFNDPIHGHVELHPLLVKIIDTPQFQRLRYIKQLGGGYYVYPGASHNRFEHSIGVAHLAGELAQALQTRQPELDITDRDILCVQIAGLCHDLGHGPFSHLYDAMFIPETEKKGWKHEDGSVKMFDYLVEKNDLKGVMEEHGLKPDADAENDLIFIKEMINGPDTQTADGELQYKGRKEEKWFLYEIVANKTTGIDVDKFDYFARDCHHLGIRNNFDHQRFIKFARVCKVAGKQHICTRDKEEYNMYEMFHTRLSLHKRAYQHKTTKIIEHMIAEAFLKADKHIKIKGKGVKIYTLSTARDDMKAYTKLTDHVFEQILNPISVELKETVETNDTEDPVEPVTVEEKETVETNDTEDPVEPVTVEEKETVETNDTLPVTVEEKKTVETNATLPVTVEEKELKEPNELKVARGILKRIVSRDFYKFLGEWTMDEKPKPPSVTGQQQVTPGSASKLEHLSIKEMEGTWKEGLAEKLQLNSKDFVVSAVTLDYGMKDKNPMKNLHFYSKNDHTKAVKGSTEVSKLLPTCFSETMIRVYCKKTTDSNLTVHKDLFKKWCTNNSSKSIWKGKKQQPPTTSSS